MLGGGFELLLDRESGVRERLAPFVVEKGWKLYEMKAASRSLEDVFLELTGSEARSGGEASE